MEGDPFAATRGDRTGVGALFRLFTGLSLFFGARRRFVRRLAGVCLLILGVHAGADLLDDVAYQLVDALDLLVDESVAAFLSWLASIGGMKLDEAARHAEAFASWADLPQKDRAALVLALAVELAVDVALLDLAWGTRRLHASSRGLLGGLVDSARELRASFRALDLERLAVLPTLLALALGGALVAARAAEGVAADALATLLPNAVWASNAAAGAALVAAATLLWRFVPDLLDGAILRSYERGAQAHARVDDQLAARTTAGAVKHPRVARARALATQKTRGKLVLFVALPLALASLFSQSDLLGLLARLGGA